MKNILGLFALLALTSCESMQSTTTNQDGKQVHKLTCSEFNTSKQDCEAQANELCANGLERTSYYKEEYGDPGDGFKKHTRHHYTVECKK